MSDQLGLFRQGHGAAPATLRGAVQPVDHDAQIIALGERIPPAIRLGTSSWSFPGWQGLVYQGNHREARLAQHGLSAYAAHPLFGTVGVDRTFYAPVTAQVFAEYAAVVPESFRFVVKAHDALTLARFPMHARYGAQRGLPNALLFDTHWARDQVVGPFVDGLGERAGVLLFQFAPQPAEWFSSGASGANAKSASRRFAERLYRFLRDLPPGPRYAVEVRTPSLLTADFAACLKAAGVVPCLAVMPGLPDVEQQAELTQAREGSTLMIRWLLAPHHDYEGARAAYHPFNTLVDPDHTVRASIARLLREALGHGHGAFVIVNNKAEGSSPLSVQALASALVDGERAVEAALGQP